MGERSQSPGKQTAFDTDIRVPLIVTGPDVPAGVTLTQMVQNIDLCPTFTELALTPPPATVDGRSLVRLLRGQPTAAWRNVALIEHHDPAFDPNDPDADTTSLVQGPPTYNALRTANGVYVEYVGNETEYHDLATDPFELHNTVGQLSPNQRAKLHDTLLAITTCKTNSQCWVAQHMQ
jgi:arylsulfatase A-like enzyme